MPAFKLWLRTTSSKDITDTQTAQQPHLDNEEQQWGLQYNLGGCYKEQCLQPIHTQVQTLPKRELFYNDKTGNGDTEGQKGVLFYVKTQSQTFTCQCLRLLWKL